ncbi:MAG: sulfite exporter TauE/SafE family protein [Verrucomicrobiota bacterium]
MDLFGFSVWEVAVRLALGLAIGFCIGLTGVGGGVLGLQAMTLVLKMEPVTAVGTTGLYIFLTKISATFHHAGLRNIDWKVSARILAGALPANLLVAWWVSREGGSAEFVEALEVFIVSVVLLAAAMMILNTATRLKTRVEQKERTLAAKIEEHRIWGMVFPLVAGALLGGIIGATSLGGGCLIVPVLVAGFGLAAQRAVGSSIFIALFLTLVTAVVYGKEGEVVLSTAATMAAGSLVGVRFGSMFSVRLSEQVLRFVVVGLILVAAGIMVLSR